MDYKYNKYKTKYIEQKGKGIFGNDERFEKIESRLNIIEQKLGLNQNTSNNQLTYEEQLVLTFLKSGESLGQYKRGSPSMKDFTVNDIERIKQQLKNKNAIR